MLEGNQVWTYSLVVPLSMRHYVCETICERANRKHNCALFKRTMTTVGTKTYVMNIGSHEHNLICSANKQTKTFRMGNDSNRNVRPQHPIPYILEILKRKGAVTLYYRVRSRLASTQNQGAQG